MRIAATPRCPSCEAREVRKVGALPHVTVFAGRNAADALPASSLFRCVACGLAFRHPILTSSAYDSLYGKADPAAWPGGPDRVDWALIEGFLARNFPAGANLLDFGCHTGGLLQRIGPRHARTGIEVNENAAQVAREKAGAEVFPSLESLPLGKRFDLVTAVDVVEHFADPGRVIAALLEVVKPGGALIITTGDADAWLGRITGSRWWYCYYPEHLAFLSEQWIRHWLRTTAQRARVAEVRRFRYVRRGPLRFVRHAAFTLIYHLAPDTCAWLLRRVKRGRGRESGAEPPGSGLTKDHVFLALRKTA